MLPYFFVEWLTGPQQQIRLPEESSKHLVQVLRKKAGEEVVLTDGLGSRARATILDENRKSCLVQIKFFQKEEEPVVKVSIAISLLKNASRFEWFLEKATEIGVTEIIPLICQRTEKQSFRSERMQSIIISAMLQSQQSRMPLLRPATKFQQLVSSDEYSGGFVAHCAPGEKSELSSLIHASGQPATPRRILIGPEGDFAENEIELALAKSYRPVTLGQNRLRTETAGIVAAVILKNS